jgi:hypothetical protein
MIPALAAENLAGDPLDAPVQPIARTQKSRK